MLGRAKQHILRRQSFRGQNLSGKDFSSTDIRGADFTNAILIGADFSYTKAGQQGNWIAFIVIGGAIVAAIAGLISGYSGGLIGLLMFRNSRLGLGILLSTLSSVIFLFALLTFILLVIRQGLGKAQAFFAILLVMVAAVVATKGTAGFAVAAIISTFTLAAAIAAIMLWSLALTAIWIAAGRETGTAVGFITLMCSIPGALEGTAPIDIDLQNSFELSRILALSIAIIIIIIVFVSSLYVSWQVIAANTKFSILGSIVNAWSTLGGTSFRGADLTDADFTYANLKGADFRSANITRTCWFQAKKLEQARTERTYLEDLQVRRLLVLKDAQGEEFNSRNLRGVNLKDANLQKVKFISSDLSETTLENANLAGAKLAKSRLYRSNLSGACLTGAVIQDWAISTDTKFEKVRCEFIYMRLPTQDDLDPWRKPDNTEEFFKEGDFSDFITPIIKTLALYNQQNFDLRRMATTFKTLDFFHHDKIDPSAAAIALKQLAEQYPEAGIEVVALEGRGEEKIRLQARVTGETDRSKLSAEYIEKYQEIASLPYGDLQSLLAAMVEKDERIRSLEKMVMTAMKSDKFYVETYYAFGDSSDANQTVKKILILTANPQNIDKRCLDAEVREIQTGLERAKKRDQFEIISKWAVRPDDLRRALLDYEPQIVHFSGFGSATEGLALENELGQLQMVSTAALAKLFEVFQDKVECVLLNACYSETQAEGIRQHIDYVIGMHQNIGNRAAIEFAVGFYDALGAGRSIDDAFKLGCIAIDLEGIPESLTPVLKKKNV